MRSPALALSLLLSLPAGAEVSLKDRRPVTPATPAAAATTTTTPAAGPYSGLGAESVPPEVMAKFRAAPLPSTVTRRVQAILDVRSPTAGILSPDGKHLFFTWAVTGVRQVWRLDGANSFPIQMTGGEDATSVVGVTLDGKQLVLSRDQKGEENPGLYLQSVDGGALVVIQHKPKIQTELQHISDDGKFLYFRSNDQKPESYVLYRYVLATKAIEPIFNHDGANEALWSLADRKAAKGKTEGTLLLNKEVGGRQVEVFEYNETTRALTPLFGQGEKEDYVARYGAGDEILVSTPHFSEFRRLFVFTKKDKFFAPLTSADAKWDASFSINSARTRILVSRNEGGYTRPAVYDAKTKKPVKLPTLPKSDLFFWGSTTPDSRYTAVSLDTGVRPSASWVLDWKTGKLVSWHTPSAPEVDLKSFVPVTLEEFPARDGTKVPMFVRRPPSCATSPTPCPVIVDFHGGPESQTLAGFSGRAQLFVDAGFVVVQPNVRGSDGYGKAWVHADDGVKRKDVVTDIEDAAVFIKQNWNKNGVNPKVGVMGGSYGGYSTLMAMTMFAGAYDAGVEIVGISNLLTFLMNTAPYRRALRISEYGDPEKDKEALLALSPTTYVDRVRAPLLLIQGATDPRVPVGEALQMYEVLAKKNLGAQMIVFPDEGHGVQKRENAVLMLGHSLAFFEKHLK
ncbi:MAG: prolyl oligopeptidase family serine peptidase [Deltaproteobacteria bacterium]|nr:prolyl oligopeptidase family serine peptidase [Deltaproteobacteria bacterium]